MSRDPNKKKNRMGRVAVNFVSRFIIKDQRQHWIELCEGLLERANNDNTFLMNNVAGDET